MPSKNQALSYDASRRVTGRDTMDDPGTSMRSVETLAT